MRARVDANIFLGCIDATLVSIETKLRARSRLTTHFVHAQLSISIPIVRAHENDGYAGGYEEDRRRN